MPRGQHHPDLREISLITTLSAVSDPVRLGIVRLLADGTERQWGELDAPVSASTLSHHLKVLRTAGIVRSREQGTRSFLRLRRAELDDRFPGLLTSLVAADGHGAAEIRLKPAGVAGRTGPKRRFYHRSVSSPERPPVAGGTGHDTGDRGAAGSPVTSSEANG